MVREWWKRGTDDAGHGGLLDLCGCELGGEVERHEIFDSWVDGLQLGLVKQRFLRIFDWGLQIWLEKTVGKRANVCTSSNKDLPLRMRG